MKTTSLTHCVALFSLSFTYAAPELVPSKEVPQIQIQADTDLKVFADHKSHGVFSPTAISIDEQGRVLVTETWRFMNNRGIDDNRQRRYWIHEDIAAQTTADRLAMYKKWYPKHPPEHYTRHAEKIRMLFDADNNGVADKHTIFADRFNDPLDGTAAGIFSYNGNVYFACIPHIWLLKDKDNDGVADTRTSLQEGFGVRVSFSGHDLNGFAFGPDGRIYATIGDRGFNIKTKEGKHYAYPGQGAILRFEPDGSNMEVIHIGLRNPKEIAFDQFGNAITVDNNSDQGDRARVVYVMEGGDSGWRMGHQILHSFHRTAGLAKRPINRWMQEKMWQPRDEKTRNLQPAYILPPLMNLTSGPSGLTYHPGPTSYPGKPGHFLISDYKGSPRHSRIHSFAVANHGAGMKVTEDFIYNNGVAVTDVEYGYDGKIYVADFIGGWSAHAAGRIYSLTKKGSENDTIAKEVSQLVTQDFTSFPTKKLIDLLGHQDMRIRLRTQFALAEKKNPQLFEDALTSHKQLIPQLHAIWGLGMIARREHSSAKQATARLVFHAMNASNPEMKAQIAKCLGEAKGSEKVDLALMHLIKASSPRVQAFAAIALGKIKHKPAFNPLVALIAKNNNQDVYLRHACVVGLLGSGNIKQFLSLKNHSSPAVRLAAVLALRHHRSPEVAQFIHNQPEAIRDEAIRAIHDLPIIPAQSQVADILPRYARTPGKTPGFTPMMQRRLVHAAFRVGGDKNIRALLAYIGSPDSTIDLNQRREAIRLLSLWNTPPKIDQSLGRWNPLPPRNNTHLTQILQQELPKLLSQESPVTAELLALSTHYKLKLDALPVEKLIAIVKNKKLSGEARAEALRSIAQNPPSNFEALLASLVSKNHATVAATALQLHMKLAPKKSTPLIIAATQLGEAVSLRQKAWKLTAEANSIDSQLTQHLNQALEQLAAGKGDKQSTLEILAAGKKHPKVSAALAKYKATLDPKDPLSPYLATIHGGNTKKGEAIFRSHPAAQCMRCHTTEKHHDVAMAGPNLSSIAKQGDRRFLLESLVNPNATIAKGYGKVSAMPPMGLILKKEELRDLIAYLSTLK